MTVFHDNCIRLVAAEAFRILVRYYAKLVRRHIFFCDMLRRILWTGLCKLGAKILGIRGLELRMQKQIPCGQIGHQRGMTLAELLIALLIASVLAVFALPMFGSGTPNCDSPDTRQGPIMRAKIAQVTGDIGKIHMALSTYELSYSRYPDSLADIGLGDLRDPWDNPYQYLVVFGRQNVGPVRKDHNLKPVNTGYDVYSMGPDGVTASPFTSTPGKDDIVMANDGDYFGLACQYNGSGKN